MAGHVVLRRPIAARLTLSREAVGWETVGGGARPADSSTASAEICDTNTHTGVHEWKKRYRREASRMRPLQRALCGKN